MKTHTISIDSKGNPSKTQIKLDDMNLNSIRNLSLSMDAGGTSSLKLEFIRPNVDFVSDCTIIPSEETVILHTSIKDAIYWLRYRGGHDRVHIEEALEILDSALSILETKSPVILFKLNGH